MFVCKVEKPAEQLIHMYTFIVTNMDSESEKVIRFYCKRGIMENYIKESKNGFDFAAVSSSSRIVNANRLQIHALAYNIFNWFKRLALSASMRKHHTLKTAENSRQGGTFSRYITFKLCSSCPYKNVFPKSPYNSFAILIICKYHQVRRHPFFYIQYVVYKAV